jgi:hypothetical protein
MTQHSMALDLALGSRKIELDKGDALIIGVSSGADESMIPLLQRPGSAASGESTRSALKEQERHIDTSHTKCNASRQIYVRTK